MDFFDQGLGKFGENGIFDQGLGKFEGMEFLTKVLEGLGTTG